MSIESIELGKVRIESKTVSIEWQKVSRAAKSLFSKTIQCINAFIPTELKK